MVDPQEIHKLIAAALPGAKIEVLDPMRDGEHLQAVVAADAFAGFIDYFSVKMADIHFGGVEAARRAACTRHLSIDCLKYGEREGNKKEQ